MNNILVIITIRGRKNKTNYNTTILKRLTRHLHFFFFYFLRILNLYKHCIYVHDERLTREKNRTDITMSYYRVITTAAAFLCVIVIIMLYYYYIL